MVVQVCFPGNSVPRGQSGEPMFLRDIRCVFPSGISSRKSLAKFAFQEMLVSLCFCQRSQRVGAALEFHSRSSESLSSKRGRWEPSAASLVLQFHGSWNSLALGSRHFSPSSCSSSHGIGHLGDQNISWKKVWEKAQFRGFSRSIFVE